MAQLTRTNLKTKYNDSGIGLYKDNGTKAITASRVRTNVDDEADSALFWEDVIDEDSFATDSATRPPSQQSVKAYIASVDHYRGVHDLSTEAYPSSGGTGAAGIPAAGDYWIGGNSGDFDVQGLGTITLFRGAMLHYIGGDVSLPNSWVVKQ